VLEVLTGQRLDDVLTDRVLAPLGMQETVWWAQTEQDRARLAALYVPNPADGTAVRYDALGDHALRAPGMLSGGGGLLSTASDYARFTSMLVNGGELDGQRVLSPRTLRYMTRNHLPGGASLASIGRGMFAETAYDGIGFGLGFGVTADPVAAKVTSNPGEFTWGGYASTAFWVDPAEQLTVAFYTQLVPSSTYPIRTELRQLVQAALVD
jgi:CubicO group peptidase (beta-lactamase class C family)